MISSPIPKVYGIIQTLIEPPKIEDTLSRQIEPDTVEQQEETVPEEVSPDFIYEGDYKDTERDLVYQLSCTLLPVEGQNSGLMNELLLSDAEFQQYLSVNRRAGYQPVVEDNDDMRGSYAMVDPAGRFFDSSLGYHRYSKPILESGVEAAYNQVGIREDKFNSRGGYYDWRV